MLSNILSSQTRDFQPGAVLPGKGFILATSGGIFGCHPGRDYYWHLVDRSQGCCLTRYRAQAPKQRPVWPKMSVVLRLRNPLSDFSTNHVYIDSIASISVQLYSALN